MQRVLVNWQYGGGKDGGRWRLLGAANGGWAGSNARRPPLLLCAETQKRSGLTLDCDFAQRREPLPIRNAQVARTCRSCRTVAPVAPCVEKKLARNSDVTPPARTCLGQNKELINSLFSGGVATMTIRHRLSLWPSRALSFQPTVQYKGREETRCALAARLATFAVAVTRATHTLVDRFASLGPLARCTDCVACMCVCCVCCVCCECVCDALCAQMARLPPNQNTPARRWLRHLRSCVLLPKIRVTTARTMLCRSCSPHSSSCLQPPTSGL